MIYRHSVLPVKGSSNIASNICDPILYKKRERGEKGNIASLKNRKYDTKIIYINLMALKISTFRVYGYELIRDTLKG